MRVRFLAMFLFLYSLLTACGDPSPKTVGTVGTFKLVATPSKSATVQIATQPELATPTQGGLPLLEWQGLAVAGENDAPGCKVFQITAGEQILFGPCGQPLGSLPVSRTELNEMFVRLEAFELRTPQESLVFRGKGDIGSPAWHRAVLAWAKATYFEVAAGHICAACRSVLSWTIGPVEGQEGDCKHLNVLDYGYAYAEIVSCNGTGEARGSKKGWVDTGSWEQLDTWLYGRSRLEKGNDFFDGKGSQPMSLEEQVEVDNLAKSIFESLEN
jgi:hypothetical protein